MTRPYARLALLVLLLVAPLSACAVRVTPATASLRIHSGTPVDANDCKDGGWRDLQQADTTPFESQGDCVSYVQKN